jgi:hypothetical protein
LTCIEAWACWATKPSFVVVPGSISFIAGGALPLFCALTLAGSDYHAEFRTWNKRRQSGSSDAFERRAPGMRGLVTEESRDDEEKRLRLRKSPNDGHYGQNV